MLAAYCLSPINCCTSIILDMRWMWIKRRQVGVTAFYLGGTVSLILLTFCIIRREEGETVGGGKEECPLTVALILCQAKESGVANSFRRQINQTIVLLKSIALQVKGCANVFIVAENKERVDTIVDRVTKEWGGRWGEKLNFSYVAVKYPKGVERMANMFRPCATLRLFLPDLLPSEVTTLLYVDTDVIFLDDPAKLVQGVNEKGSFDENNKLAALAPCLFHYGSNANMVPYFGKRGLNAGLMVMNLRKMRETSWTTKVRIVADMYANKIKLADQDILNIFFHFFPEELLEIGCDWNFRPFQCRPGSHCDKLSDGISALHGNALSFTSFGHEPLFEEVFSSFERLHLNDELNMEIFLDELESDLMAAEDKWSRSQCAQYGGFSSLLLYKLRTKFGQIRLI